MASYEEGLWEWVERECEKAVAEVVAPCPWMGEEDVVMLRQVFAVHFGSMVAEAGDVEMMAGNLLALAGRAEEVGDRRRQFAFEQWYGWACAALRGEEYQEAEMPEELAALP